MVAGKSVSGMSSWAPFSAARLLKVTRCGSGMSPTHQWLPAHFQGHVLSCSIKWLHFRRRNQYLHFRIIKCSFTQNSSVCLKKHFDKHFVKWLKKKNFNESLFVREEIREEPKILKQAQIFSVEDTIVVVFCADELLKRRYWRAAEAVRGLAGGYGLKF